MTYYIRSIIAMLLVLSTPIMVHSTTLGALPSSTQMEEFCQDSIGAMIDASLNYVDGTPLLQRAALTGDCTATAGSNALTIPNNTIIYAKMQDVSAASKLIGRGDSGAGDPQEITLGTGLTMTGTTLSASAAGYTDEQAQDAIGTILVDSSTIDFTYTDATPAITASVITDTSVQQIEVTKNSGAVVATRKQLNLIEGTGITLTIADDVGNNQIDVTVTGSALYTDEMAQDAVGAMVDTTLVYTDGTPLLTRAALTGDVTASAGSNATVIANDVVTNTQMANMATATFKGRTTAGSGDPEDLTVTQATAMLNTVVADSGAGGVKGLAPATGAGDAAAGKFLKADATWAVPSATLSGGAANKVAYWTSSSALSNDTDLHWDSSGNNLGIGVATFGTTLHNGIAIAHDATNFPTTNVTDTVQLYARDQTGSTNASLFVKAEAGGISSIGNRIVVGNGGALLSNGVDIGGLQLDGAGPHLQMSNVASVAHGATGAGVATSTFFDARPIVAADGGVQLRGITETNLAMILSSVVVTDPVSTKSTTSDGALKLEFGKKFISTPEAMAAGVNLVSISDAFAGGLGTRWIVDNDGDTWQTGRLSALGLDLRGATSGTLSFTPAATVTSYTLVWPAAQGAASTVLTNDGSGGLSWAAGGGGSGDITDVWACTTGNCNAITGASGDSFDAGSADASSPTTRSTSLPGTCTEGQHHQDTDSGGTETYVCTAANTWVKLASTNGDNRTIPISFDGGGLTLTTGARTAYWSPEHAGTITKWRILAVTSGSIVIDIWKDTYANYPPTVADTITASAKPTVTTAVKGESSTLTGWTTTFSAGDVFEFNIDSVTTITKAILYLTYTVN